jgi:hypothetical protein
MPIRVPIPYNIAIHLLLLLFRLLVFFFPLLWYAQRYALRDTPDSSSPIAKVYNEKEYQQCGSQSAERI